MSVISSISAKKRVIAELLAEFLAELEGIQAIFIRHIFRAKVSYLSRYCPMQNTNHLITHQ